MNARYPRGNQKLEGYQCLKNLDVVASSDDRFKGLLDRVVDELLTQLKRMRKLRLEESELDEQLSVAKRGS